MDFANHLQLLIESVRANSILPNIIYLFSAVGAIAGGPRLINSLREWRDRSRSRQLATTLNAASGIAAFTQEDLVRARQNYIEPNCTQIDPSDEDDVRAVVALAPLFKTIDDHINLKGEKRHIILLADSGMGKTSFCINYYVREQKKKATKRKSIVIIPLGRSDVIEKIKNIQDKRNTILFLDAFDEAPEAVGNEQGHLTVLMTVASDFKNIVVTCRSQFFSSDDAIPKGSGIIYAGARKAGVRREFPLHKLFLAPLSSEQINRFLLKHFPYTSLSLWRKRASARKLVDAIPELSVRPMLLELLPDLVREGQSIYQLFGLYRFLIEKWLQRERDWIDESDLLGISTELAVVMYTRQRSGEGDRISADLLTKIASAYHRPLETWKLKSRSLLNRDIEGNFKFAHRSIMEFLFVSAALHDDYRCFRVDWTDMMKDFLVSLEGLSIDGENSEEFVLKLFNSDLSKTGIFPLASPLQTPRIRSTSECKDVLRNPFVSSRHSRRIPLAWRNARLIIRKIASGTAVSAYEIEDTVHGITWKIVDFGSSTQDEERSLYRESSLPLRNQFIDQSWRSQGVRSPSLEEMITLWESEPYLCISHGLNTVFEDHEMYWLGDRIDGHLLCSFGEEPKMGEHIRLIGSRVDGHRKIHLYELIASYGYVAGGPFMAMNASIIDTAEESGGET